MSADLRLVPTLIPMGYALRGGMEGTRLDLSLEGLVLNLFLEGGLTSAYCRF